MKDVRLFVENIVHDRNDIIARLAMMQNVDLSISNWDSFKPNEALQNDALEELSDLAVYFENEYKSLSLTEILLYCKERYKFSEHWSGIWKDDALKLLGLDSCSDIDILFSGLF